MFSQNRKMGVAAACLAAACMLAQFAAAGESWKAPGPVTIRVANNAGGIMDIVTRIVAQGLQDSCGQTVVVSNIVGANGALAANDLLSLDASPREMMVTPMPLFTMAPLMNPNINVDINDFQIVANLIADDFLLFVCPEKTGIKDFAGLLEYGKNNRVLFGSNPPGGSTHMLPITLFSLAGVKDHKAVTSNGSPTDLLAVASGNVTCAVATMGAGRQFVEQGSLVPVAVFSEQPYTRMGLNVPTVKSFGYDIVMQSCNFLSVKKGVDPAVVDQIYRDIQAYYGTEKFKKLSETAGYVPDRMNGAEMLRTLEEAQVLAKGIFEKHYKK